MPVNRVGAALDDTVRPHDRPPVSPEDLNRAQADKVRDGGGLASNVLNHRYGERGSIRECLEYMAGVSRDRDVNQCTAAELNQIDLIPPIARLANENSPRYQGVQDDAVREFLRLKKQRKVDREGANWHFRLPELSLQKCPKARSWPLAGIEFTGGAQSQEARMPECQNATKSIGFEQIQWICKYFEHGPAG